MAAPDLWLPTEMVRESLSLAEVKEDTAHVERCRDAAVRLATRITKRPLTGATARFVVPREGSGPITLDGLRDVHAAAEGSKEGLASIGYWGRDRTGAPATDMVDGNGAPDVAAVERVVEQGEPWDVAVPYRIWPTGGAWPVQAVWFEVRMALDVNPTLNEDIRQACLFLFKHYYPYTPALTADERRGMQLVLPGVSAWIGSERQ